MKRFAQSKHNFSVSGFTLAEVLITLAIIGVVAAMTIPALIQSVQKDQYVSKLKKEYSVLSQAFNMLKADNGGSIIGTSFDSSTGGATASATALNDLATYLKVSKNCGSGMGCWFTTPLYILGAGSHYTNTDSSWNNSYGKAMLTDGTLLQLNLYNSNCTLTPISSATGSLKGSVCGYMYIDVNGTSRPNTQGRDVFVFWISKNGIYPFGINNDGYSCDANNPDDLTSLGCAGKVLTEGAMNY